MLKKSLQQCLRTQQSVLESMAQGKELNDCLFRVFRNLESAVQPYTAKAFLLVKEPKGVFSHIAGATAENCCELVGHELSRDIANGNLIKLNPKSRIISDLTQPSFSISSYLQQRLLHNGWRSLWVEPIYSSSEQCLGMLVFQTREVYEPDQNGLDLMSAYVGVLRCILEKYQKDFEVKVLNEQLKASLDRLQVYYQVMPDIGMVINEEGEYVDVYGAHDVLGYKDAESLIGKTISENLDTAVAKDIMEATRTALESNKPEVFEYEMIVNGEVAIFESRVVPIEQYLKAEPEKRHVVWVARDITKRRLSEKRIERLAFYDPLTQLPNRRLLMDRLQHTIEHVKRQKTIGALIFEDLDGFKQVNDQFGHDYGDELLTAVAQRLNESLRDSDTVARFGGDEFVIVLERFDDNLEDMYNEVMNVSRRVLDCLKPGITVRGQSFLINASLGISMIYGAHISADTVIHEADQAMYQAKHTGKGQICMFKAS